MKRSMMVWSVALSGVLAACGQQANIPVNGVSAYAQRPELQDAESQAILAQYANDPGLLAALQTAYGERAPEAMQPGAVQADVPALNGLSLTPLDLSSDRLVYVKSVGWGSVNNYNTQYSAYAGGSLPYPGLNWTRDGCSTPSGLGLGYTEDFRPACNVHDFGYRNLKVFERTDANRKATDEAFHGNMDAICAAKSWYKRPACYTAAYAYYQGVRVGGGGSF
jgi:hypothetical protein